jgi:hypothetical protein
MRADRVVVEGEGLQPEKKHFESVIGCPASANLAG